MDDLTYFQSPLSLSDRSSGVNHEAGQDETSSNGNKDDEDDDDDESEDKIDTQQHDPERLKAFNVSWLHYSILSSTCHVNMTIMPFPCPSAPMYKHTRAIQSISNLTHIFPLSLSLSLLLTRIITKGRSTWSSLIFFLTY